jgi:hypothetical protein
MSKNDFYLGHPVVLFVLKGVYYIISSHVDGD